jgi:hypothetical protein
MPRGNYGPNNEPDNDNDNEDGRGFNNPNISVSVKFKNKIRNNNYEFIVTIEPERLIEEEVTSPSSPSTPIRQGEFYKQYKVKRNLYEFQELFNYLETKNPHDTQIR